LLKLVCHHICSNWAGAAAGANEAAGQKRVPWQTLETATGAGRNFELSGGTLQAPPRAARSAISPQDMGSFRRKIKPFQRRNGGCHNTA
jgi:hypothetical protein